MTTDPTAPDLDGEETAAPTALALRDPRVPVTLSDLAALRGAAIEVLDARVLILETARKRAIRMTHPEDWVLFKSPDERVTAYLQDAGCDRVRDILGVEIFGLSVPEKIPSADGGSFTYIIRGDGRSRLTLQVVEAMEGGRSSGDDFCKGKTGADLELTVRKAARANLDGNITRELTGLKSIPIAELMGAWLGTTKSVEHCRKGRGFGTQNERHGGTRESDPDVEAPTCPHCPPVNGQAVRLKYRPAKGDRKAFYGCQNFEKHADKKVIIDAAKWVSDQAARAAAVAATPAPTFDRSPGEEG
jgi:hypothetical protein